MIWVARVPALAGLEMEGSRRDCNMELSRDQKGLLFCMSLPLGLSVAEAGNTGGAGKTDG
jgi:hypothetical protein